MQHINRVTLLGQVASDPSVVRTNWRTIAFFLLRTEENHHDQEGQPVTQTMLHQIVVKNLVLVGIAEKHVRIGDHLYVEGGLRLRELETGSHAMVEVVLGHMNAKLIMLKEKAQLSAPLPLDTSSSERIARPIPA